MLNVCLILHASRSTNLGVGALTVAQVALLRRIARKLGIPVQITLLDWQDRGHVCVEGDDIVTVHMTRGDLLSPWGMWRHLRGADLVLDIGAGDSFADTYGSKRLHRIFFMKYLVHLARRPLVLAPQTLGPFTSMASRVLSKGSIARSALVFSRDNASAKHLHEIGCRKDIKVASDVALRLEPSPSSRLPRRTAVGINVSGLLMAGGYNASNQFGLNVNYASLIRTMIAAFLAHPDRPEVHLIPHVISPDRPIEDDMAAILKLAGEFPKARVAPAFQSPSEAKGYIGQMSFFAGSRMHACIAALSSGVAVVPLAYSRKFIGLFGALGYDFVADCRTHRNDAILEMIMLGFENRVELSAKAELALNVGLERLDTYEQHLTDLILGIASAKETPATRYAAGLIGRA